MSTAVSPSAQIQWKQLVSLVALDIAIIISWIAYHKYQPQLLGQFGFTEFKFPLAVLQAVILFVTPPLAGLAADRLVRKGGNRLPVVTIGINFVSMVFMVVAFTILANPDGFIRLLFPVMIALWLISMNIFHSPAISAVEIFVPAGKLPQAIAIFAVVADLAQSIEPSIVDLIDFFGAPLTFAVGGALVFGTGFWFTRAAKHLTTQRDAQGNEAQGYDVQKSNLPLVFLLGAGMGVATMFFFELFPAWSEEQLPFLAANGFKGAWFSSILIAFAALISYPMGIFVEKQGVNKMAVAGGLAAAALIAGASLTSGYVALAFYVLFPVAFALVTVSFLPIAFLSLERRHRIFGIGLFFSGVELANSVLDVVQAA